MPYVVMYFRIRYLAFKCVWACREVLLSPDFPSFGFPEGNRFRHAIEIWKSGMNFHEKNEIAIMMGAKKRNV